MRAPEAEGAAGADLDDLALLTRAARGAGEIALGYWRNAPKSWEKDDSAGPVTEADLAVNDYLAALLGDARPAYGWLSEESADDAARLDAESCFIIDPIDGTRAFLAGEPGFSHSLAVVRNGRPQVGVVYLPAQDILFTAVAGQVSMRNGVEIHVTDPGRLDGATVMISRPNMDPALWRDRRVPPFRREFRPSIAWRLCLVAEGRFDAVMTLMQAWEWDIAAGVLIAAEAGAKVTDRHGHAMRFNGPTARIDGMIVAGPATQANLLHHLAPV
ncbi:inositol monophosphatase family protein [Paracoccus pacificus]|uniref:Inositol monophosphatase family protein n=1 Tax=Paracoccus pacificus TaxID=1463598 RepID=A0ABW4R3C9_9RHOB